MSRGRGAVRAVLGVACLFGVSCGAELPDVPYRCDVEPVCPEGFSCEAGLCVRTGALLGETRVVRGSWFNAAELTWFPSVRGDGATLVANDGFTDDPALYEVVVAADGRLASQRTLLDLPDDYPTSTAVVALDDARYGILTYEFPGVDGQASVVRVLAVEREASGEPTVEELWRSERAFLGGTEPAYVGAVAREDGIHFAFGDPSGGGRIVVGHVAPGDAAATIRVDEPLPGQVLPLSADCLLWDAGDALFVRLGLEEVVLLRVDDETDALTEVAVPEGLPVAVFSEQVVSRVTGPPDEDGVVSVELRTYSLDGEEFADRRFALGAAEQTLEPHTATGDATRRWLAPSSDDPYLSSMDVVELSPDAPPRTVASLARTGDDSVYSGRAFARDGRVYLAWTAFHETLMDLWVAAVDEGAP